MLKGKVVIVTGGTRGIGYAIVKKFLENGARVVLCGSTDETAANAVNWRLRSQSTAPGMPAHIIDQKDPCSFK